MWSDAALERFQRSNVGVPQKRHDAHELDSCSAHRPTCDTGWGGKGKKTRGEEAATRRRHDHNTRKHRHIMGPPVQLIETRAADRLGRLPQHCAVTPTPRVKSSRTRKPSRRLANVRAFCQRFCCERRGTNIRSASTQCLLVLYRARLLQARGHKGHHKVTHFYTQGPRIRRG